MFKDIFLGHRRPPCSRAANSQKCIRVGGKHNDLDVVGTDGYHHTFFEMLGSWSFGDYFKEEACRLAWNLLTGPYRLDPQRLYVTYFGGDEVLNLKPDLETRDIWRAIGVSPDHILPFGCSDNLWEMGSSGPCGPCTEIHFDHIEGRCGAASRVNQGHDDLTEIWNLVFIQYNRMPDGSLKDLPQCHVDTGMGLERLVAVLQGKQSNYSTDLFQPLFSAIQKIAKSSPYRGTFGSDDCGGLDTAYRTLADHARMVTVAISDGMFPDQNPKLRRVLRRALHVAKKTFNQEKGLLLELTNYVAESLADTYPEIGARLKQTQLIIKHEEELFSSGGRDIAAWQDVVAMNPGLQGLDITEFPGLLMGYYEVEAVSRLNPPLVSAELAFKLYDTFGLGEEVVCQLAAAFGMQVDTTGFRLLLSRTRIRSRDSHVLDMTKDLSVINELTCAGVIPTDDSLKYVYHKQPDYVFPSVKCQVCAIIVEGRSVFETDPGTVCGVVLDRTNLYHESGGQAGDTGLIHLSGGTKMLVKDIVNVQGFLIHQGSLEGDTGCGLRVGDTVTLEVNPERRLGNMRNHTATHLLNAALHQQLTVTCQKSSHVTDSHLTFDFAVYGESFSAEDVVTVEGTVQRCIAAAAPVCRRTVPAHNLNSEGNVTVVPGEVYPQDDVHLIEIEVPDLLTSREACCGTHVLNTRDLESFYITNVRAPSAGIRSVKAVTGTKAKEAARLGEWMVQRVAQLVQEVHTTARNLEQVEALEAKVQSLKQELTNNSQLLLPYSCRSHCLDNLETLSKSLKDEVRSILRKSFESEMQEVIQKVRKEGKQPFIVHFLQSSSSVDAVPLQKATKLCSDLPVLLLALDKGMVKARCCVPEEMASDNFNAKLWLRPVLDTFKVQGFTPRGQDERLVFNMKGKKVKETELQALVKSAVKAASELAQVALQ
ncbi:alanine--tRNA ligase, mitochondrial isoform X2 [Anabrus simplex]|uniref:alanine--tRNA ligase, mitochondrial isoform X2 n=1 Tax=Anabrus simplex TaxID=316456 RepID=UPI0035A319B4